jgi:hypothetical protein
MYSLHAAAPQRVPFIGISLAKRGREKEDWGGG